LLSTTILGAAGGAWSMTSKTDSVAQPRELATGEMRVIALTRLGLFSKFVDSPGRPLSGF